MSAAENRVVGVKASRQEPQVIPPYKKGGPHPDQGLSRSRSSSSTSSNPIEEAFASPVEQSAGADPAPFADGHRPMLSFIASAALQCVEARSVEVLLDGAFLAAAKAPLLCPATGEVAVVAPNGDDEANEQAKAHQSVAPIGAAASSSSSPSTSLCDLAEVYAEVGLLKEIHFLRCALRDLQECPPLARRPFFLLIGQQLIKLHLLLPDPLFAALAIVVQRVITSTDVTEPISQEYTHVLEVQLLHVIEALQVEILRQTRQLTVRAAMITVRYRHTIPFCV